MYSFIYNNINSIDQKIRVKKVNNLSLPTRSVQKISIDGRDGDLIIDNGNYNNRLITLECQIIAESATELNMIAERIAFWLQGDAKYKQLILSDVPDVFYEATCINQINISRVIMQVGSFNLIFECKPHRYNLDNQLIILTTPTSIYNSGTISKPIIKIYGTGAIDLTINSTIINLINVNGYVTIDSDLMDCYKDTELKNNYMNGDFPELVNGTNNISWTGNVSKIEITPNWRYL